MKASESGFQGLGIGEELIHALTKHNIIEPTKVQEQVIPLIHEGKDVLCQSETGSGKTISFAVPIIDQLTGAGGARVLVVAPTRELAKQIAEEFIKFSKHKGLRTVTVYGGVSMGPQIEAIPDADIVVGTPGRILDLHKQGYLKLDLIKHLVLDECDRMFDMGFIEDIEAIIYSTPQERQMLLFSATVSSQIRKITAKYMNEPENVRVTPHLVRGKLTQSYYVCAHNQKISLLAHLLRGVQERTIVFCRTKRMADMVARAMSQNGFKAEPLHGDMSQARRERVVDNFSKGKTLIVVATDVASRGLHIDDIALVVNYSLPEETETYVHRVGRTARQGKPGEAVVLLDEQDFRAFDDIMHHYEGEIEKREAHGVKKVMFRKDANSGGRNFRRGGSRQGGRGNSRDGPRNNNRRGFRKSGGETFSVKAGPTFTPRKQEDPHGGHSLADLD